jgi:hypothetical protein
MKAFGVWFLSFASTVMGGFVGSLAGLALLWKLPDRTWDLGLIYYPLVAFPILVAVHSGCYVFLRREKPLLRSSVAIISAAACFVTGTVVIAKAHGYY